MQSKPYGAKTMQSALDLRETPKAENTVMIIGWRQWADAGSISSALPRYLLERTKSRKIGDVKNDGFYLFQFPGTHDLVRPVVKFEEGFPAQLELPKNEFYYGTVDTTGVVYFLGDEPHMDVERYANAVLDAAQALNVSRIISFGGVYAEVPYNKERSVSVAYSKKSLKEELSKLSVMFSNYHGGASISSVLTKLAGERDMDYIGLYAFVPTYDLSRFSSLENAIRLENDFMAWHGVMKRVNYLLKTQFDLTDLEKRSEVLVSVLDDKIEELQSQSASEVRDYFEQLAANFEEEVFEPLDDVWETELGRLLDEGEEE
jgi:proteasome assembly chaperone (PAC2) family protein